jgi:hypothetical protein
VDDGLEFFAVDDGDEFPPGDEPFPADNGPVVSADDARFDMGGPGNV